MSDSSEPDVHLLLTALIFLQVQFAQQGRPAIAEAIEDHLRRLETCRDQLPPVLARALPRLRAQWQNFLATKRTGSTGASRRAFHTLAAVIPFRKRQPAP